MRREQTVDKNTIQRLAELDKDFAYITIEADREFVEMTELSTVAGAHDIRSFLGTLKNGSPVATIWHHTGNPVKVSIESRGQIEAVALLGKTVTLERTGDAVTIPVGAERLAIIFRHISARQAAKALADARLL
jgi:hypothetical protein